MIRADTVQSLDSCIVLQIVTCRAFETPQVVTLQNTAPLRLNSWIPFSCCVFGTNLSSCRPPRNKTSQKSLLLCKADGWHRPPRRCERSAPTVEALSRRPAAAKACMIVAFCWLETRSFNFTTIIMEVSEANRSGGAAAPASSALVGVHSLLSSEQELPITAADIIDVGRWSDGVERAGFKALTSEEWRLLAVKLQSSQNVKVLNLSGNTISADMMRDLTEHLGMLTSLQEIDLRRTNIDAEGAGRLAEPLGKLTALQELNLSGTV